MSALNTNTLSIDYTLEENTVASRTAQIYTEVDGEIVDVMNITQAASAAYENPSGGSDLPDIEIDMSGETQAAIDAIKAKIANYRSILNTSAYTNAKNQVIETIDYYKGLLDIDLTDAYGCVSVDESHPLEIINSYYLELNYLLKNYEKVQNFLAEITGNISDLKINSINRTLDNLEDDYNNLKDITEETSKITQSLIDSLSSDNLISPDEQLTLKLKLDEIVTEYVSISNSVNALIAAYTEASKPKVDENGEAHKEAFIAEDVADYLEKLNTAFNAYKKNYNKACNILIYYTAADTNRDEFGNIAIVPDYDLESLPEFYEVRQTLLDVYYEANSYYTTYNRFGSKTTWIGKDGIYSGTIMADNLRGWCLRGLTFQSAENSKTKVPDGVDWYEYHPEADSENIAFTKHTGGSGAPRWQLYKDGSGYVADGQISWQGSDVTLGNNVKIKWANVDGGKDYVDGQNNAVNEKINTLNTELNKLDTQVSILSNLTGGSTSALNEFIDIWTNDDYIDSNEIAQISKEYNQLTAEYNKVLEIAKDLNNKLQEAADRTNDPTDADYLPYPAEDFTNDIVDLTDLKELYGKAKAVYEYYTNPEHLVKDEEGKSKGYVLRDTRYDINAFATYYAEQTDVVSKCNVGLSNLQQHTRFGSKFTYIGSDGIYSGSIAADQITGLVTTSTAAQSSKKDVLPKGLVWYEKTEDGFEEITGDGKTEGPLWQLWAEGSGHLAKGNINWTAEGDLTVRGDLLGSIGNSTNTNGDVDVNGSLNIKNNNKLASSLTPSNNNTKYDTITDESDASITRYVTLSTGIPDISKTYAWQSDGANFNAPYSTLYTTRNYADTKNGTDIFDVFEYNNGLYIHIEDPCTVSSREVNTDGTYGSTSNTTISLIKNGVSYKYNSGTTKNIETDKERRSLGNTIILSDGTILTNAIVAKSGQYYGDINSDGVFKGKLDSASGYIKNCNISGSDITINGNKCFRVYKPNSVLTVSGDEETNVTNEILNISPNVTLTTNSETNYYIGTASEYNQHRKNGNITWYKTTKLATINANKGNKIKIPAISITANIYQPRKRQGKNSNPTARVYISYANGDTADVLSKKSLSCGAESYNGRQYKWSVSSPATSLTAPCTGTAYVYIDISTWMNDKQVGDYAAASFHFDVNDNIVVGSNIQQNNKIFIGNNGLQIYTNAGNIIQTINGDIELLSSNGNNGLRITNDGILIQRNGSAWTNL